MAAGRGPHRTHLSVIIVANGTVQELEGALLAVLPRCRTLGAQVVVVTHEQGGALTGTIPPYPNLLVVTASETKSLAALREAAMEVAFGDIVAVREAADVGDGTWLDAFGRLMLAEVPVAIPCVPLAADHERERVVPVGAGAHMAPLADAFDAGMA